MIDCYYAEYDVISIRKKNTNWIIKLLLKQSIIIMFIEIFIQCVLQKEQVVKFSFTSHFAHSHVTKPWNIRLMNVLAVEVEDKYWQTKKCQKITFIDLLEPRFKIRIPDAQSCTQHRRNLLEIQLSCSPTDSEIFDITNKQKWIGSARIGKINRSLRD